MSDKKLEDRIGEVVRRVTFPIEAGKIAEFARAMHDPSPIYQDKEAAAAAGYGAIPAPPTFSVASAHYSGGNAADLPIRLGLDLSRSLHGEQHWVYHRPMLAGEILTGTSRIKQVDASSNREGKPMRRVLIETIYEDASSNPVVTESMLMIEFTA